MTQIRSLQYVLLTQDPVHIGTGGYRLGRTDQTVVREPGTGLPKIPGTSISGRIRTVLASRLNQPSCAGHGGGNGHCGNCPVCYTFGWLNANGSQAGVAHINDARLLLFPIASWAGPVWITTAEILDEYGFTSLEQPAAEDEAVLSSKLKPLDGCFGLNWVVLRAKEAEQPIVAPEALRSDRLEAVLRRTVIVHPAVYSQLVNAGMEIRTSVSIDPTTGAAKKGLLFTYEAIPRATWFVLDVVIDDYLDSFPSSENGWSSVQETIEAGLRDLELVGVGGFGTRGFGRVTWVERASGGQGEEGRR